MIIKSINSVRKNSFIVFCFLASVIVFNSGCKTLKTTSYKQPLFDSTIVFEPKDGEYASTRIPALVSTPKGTLLAFCEGRVGTASDWAEMDMLMRRSTNGGRTWEPYIVIAPRQGKTPTSNATPIVDKEGNIHLLFQRDYAKAYYTKSTDDGKSWSAPVDITYAFDAFRPEYNWKVLAPGPGHAIQLKNGRLVAPVWLANSEKLEPHRSHFPSCVATIYSDDLGKTWKRGAIVVDNSAKIKNPNETMAVELEDGRVMLNIRNPTDIHQRAVAYSPDGISNWSEITFDEELYEPVCMASIIKVSTKDNGGKSRMLFVNPDTRNNPKPPRQNLTAKLSYDEGKNWTVQKVLNPGASGYSDLAVGPDGTIYCLYETNTIGKGFNYSLVLKRFNVAWLTDGKDLLKR
ncbi:MAG: exo-alpha-sialidase [Segetibacter sp.]|nr:exo-alpha-sialidase [Segetibacter sp.]